MKRDRNILIHENRENTTHDLKSLLDKDCQNELSLVLANFFSTDDLSNICDTILSTNMHNKKHDINIFEVSLYKYISNYDLSEFEIIDVLLLTHYPPVRFLEISTRINSKVDSNRFRYNYNPDIYNILNMILTDAYNYNAYCKESLTTYHVKKKLLYINFAKRVKDILDNNYTILVDMKYIINTLSSTNLFINRERFIKIYNITDDIQLEIFGVTDDIIKLSINNKADKAYIYLSRHLKGLAQIKLIFELITKELYP